MADREQTLLLQALLYEQGHPRRTQHILKVYALARLLGEEEALMAEEQSILNAAAILHDIPIRYCKLHCQGDAGQENQRRAAPKLVEEFLTQAGYLPEATPRVLELVLRHHDYSCPHGGLLGLLIEADLIVNSYETDPGPKQLEAWERLFQSQAGRALFAAYQKEAEVRRADGEKSAQA